LIIPYYITHYYIVLTFAQPIQIITRSGTGQFITIHLYTHLATHLATYLATDFKPQIALYSPLQLPMIFVTTNSCQLL